MSGCWIWLGSAMGNGYGKIHRGGRYYRKKELAHRIAYEIYVGPLADDALVCHRCDNRACVNPAHLFVGDHTANMADMARKGRQRRGEYSHLAKLTLAQAMAIKSGLDARIAARQFGVTASQAHRIAKGKSWAWINAVSDSSAT